MTTILVLIAIVGLVLVLAGSSVRIVTQYERGVVFRFGRVRPHTRGPGLALIAPIADRLRKVNMQIITQPVPAQDGITRDNVTVRVDAVLYYRVVDPVRVAVDVADYSAAILQVAQASLRSIIGKSELDDLLSNRERLNQGLELMIDNPAVGWGVHIDRVEIKDVALPESMKRSMSRQAEAERERRSRVITAEGELQASRKLADAAEVMAEHPAALQLRLLQTVVEVAAEKNSTLVLPFPVELLRFLERATPADTTNSDITSTASIADPAPRSGPPDVASTATESTSAPGAMANGVPGAGPIARCPPRPAPPERRIDDNGIDERDGPGRRRGPGRAVVHPAPTAAIFGLPSDESDGNAGVRCRRDRRHPRRRGGTGLGDRRGRRAAKSAAHRARLSPVTARGPVRRRPPAGRLPPRVGRGRAGVGAGGGPGPLGRPRPPGDHPPAAVDSRVRPARRGP